MPAAIRSRCCGLPLAACRCWSASRCRPGAWNRSASRSSDHLVYVANTGTGGSNYTGFWLHHGTLTPVPGSTVAVPAGSGLGDVFFNADGTRLVGTRGTTSQIDSFVVRP